MSEKINLSQEVAKEIYQSICDYNGSIDELTFQIVASSLFTKLLEKIPFSMLNDTEPDFDEIVDELVELGAVILTLQNQETKEETFCIQGPNWAVVETRTKNYTYQIAPYRADKVVIDLPPFQYEGTDSSPIGHIASHPTWIYEDANGPYQESTIGFVEKSDFTKDLESIYIRGNGTSDF